VFRKEPLCHLVLNRRQSGPSTSAGILTFQRVSSHATNTPVADAEGLSGTNPVVDVGRVANGNPAADAKVTYDVLSSAYQPAVDPRGSGSLLDVRIWSERSPWRLVATWAVLTAVLSANLPARLADFDWRSLILLLLLVDPFWGSIWGLVTGREGLPQGTANGVQPIWLPYLRAGSPAARLFGWEGQSVLSLLFQVALPSIVVAGLLALILGKMALAWTTLVVVLSAIGWLHRRVPMIPITFLHSLVAVGLPWSLTLGQLGMFGGDGPWIEQAVLLGMWMMHTWGGGRLLRFSGDRAGLALLAGAELGISLLLVFVQAPLWLALINVLWLPTWLAVYQNRPMQRVQIWWLAAMLLRGLAIGQSV
jgi:hypothetical protein